MGSMAGLGWGDGTSDGARSLPSHLLGREVCAPPHCLAPGLLRWEKLQAESRGMSVCEQERWSGRWKEVKLFLPSPSSPWQPPFYCLLFMFF